MFFPLLSLSFSLSLVLTQSEEINSTSSVRDVVVDRFLEAEQIGEQKSGDNAIPYLRVGQNSMIPSEYKVRLLPACLDVNEHTIRLSLTRSAGTLFAGRRIAFMSDGEQADLPANRVCPTAAKLFESATRGPGDVAAQRLERDADCVRRLAKYGGEWLVEYFEEERCTLVCDALGFLP